ncbi:hypothetical protein Csa_023597, partial [Cucumis sativus]
EARLEGKEHSINDLGRDGLALTVVLDVYESKADTNMVRQSLKRRTSTHDGLRLGARLHLNVNGEAWLCTTSSEHDRRVARRMVTTTDIHRPGFLCEEKDGPFVFLSFFI